MDIRDTREPGNLIRQHRQSMRLTQREAAGMCGALQLQYLDSCVAGVLTTVPGAAQAADGIMQGISRQLDAVSRAN